MSWLFLFKLLALHWRPVACALIVLLAFGAGWFCRPDVVKTVEVEKVVTKTVEVEKVVTKIEKQAAQVQRVIVYRDRTVTPDGTTHEREIEASEAAHVEHELLASAGERRDEQATERVVEKVIETRRDWRAGALLGVRSLKDRRPLFGIQVERRVIGELYVGAWGLNSGVVGGSLVVEF